MIVPFPSTVSVQSTARQIKNAVETNLDTGNVIVERDGDCYGYDWEIEWVSKGGSQGLIEVIVISYSFCLIVFWWDCMLSVALLENHAPMLHTCIIPNEALDHIIPHGNNT